MTRLKKQERKLAVKVFKNKRNEEYQQSVKEKANVPYVRGICQDCQGTINMGDTYRTLHIRTDGRLNERRVCMNCYRTNPLYRGVPSLNMTRRA